MSTYRGFFQGQGNMLPTSVSQVLEAVVKLIVGMGAALAILKMTNEIPLAAGGAILGVTASCLVSAIYLFGRFREELRPSAPDGGRASFLPGDRPGAAGHCHSHHLRLCRPCS